MMTDSEQITLDKIADSQYEIYPLLKQRYSPRTFEDREIGETDMKQLFEAIRWSASSFNLQPWRFIYAHKGSGAYDKILETLSDFNQKWAVNAPVLLLAVYKEKKEDGEENFHALHDLGLCVGSLTVQAQYMGIGVHSMAGVDWKKAREVFEIPKGYHVSTAIAIGYYGGGLGDLPEDLQKQETSERERIPQEKFAFENVWNTEKE